MINKKYIFIALIIVAIIILFAVFNGNSTPKWMADIGGAADVKDDLLDLNPTLN